MTLEMPQQKIIKFQKPCSSLNLGVYSMLIEIEIKIYAKRDVYQKVVNYNTFKLKCVIIHSKFEQFKNNEVI